MNHLVILTQEEDPELYLVQALELKELSSRLLTETASPRPKKAWVHTLRPSEHQPNNCFEGLALRREWKTDPTGRVRLGLNSILEHSWRGGREERISLLAECIAELNKELVRMTQPTRDQLDKEKQNGSAQNIHQG